MFAAFPAFPPQKTPVSRLGARQPGSSRRPPPSRQRSRTRDRGWILAEDLPRSPKADAVRADILDRLRQHYEEGTPPRGGRGIFYDLRPHGMPGICVVIDTKHPQIKGKGSMEATPEYVSDLLSRMRRGRRDLASMFLVVSKARDEEVKLPLENEADT